MIHTGQRLIGTSQVINQGVFDPSTIATGSNTQGTIVFALPLLIGVLGLLAFLLLGILLIKLIRRSNKQTQVNATR